MNAAVDKAVKALNDVAKNADTAEERRAVDDKILELKKLKVEEEEDLLGDGKKENPWVGTYEWVEGRGRVVIEDGGRAVIPDGRVGSWKEVDDKMVIAWPNVTDTVYRPEKGVSKLTNNYGRTFTVRKLGKGEK